MSEVEQEQSHQITLPIEWHVPENLQGHYANNVLVQPGQFEINLFFFESQIPHSLAHQRQAESIS
jgi:hypothetical protein